MPRDQSQDPVIRGFRERITEADREILASVNRRLGLVTQLHAYKAAHGYPLVDRGRETALLDELERVNPGPLSSAGLRELYATVLAVSKREAAAVDSVAEPAGE